MRHLRTIAAAWLLGAPAALAAPVDLSTWQNNSPRFPFVVGPDRTSASNGMLSQDSRSTFFIGGDPIQGQSLTATIRVDGSQDANRDRIGFALGVGLGEVPGVAPRTVSDYWLVDWQGADRTYFGGPIPAGLALSHVTGAGEEQLWTHVRNSDGTFFPNPFIAEVARGTTLGRSGWSADETYDFRINFTASLIEIFVNDRLELRHEGLFGDGGFGFFAQGQAGVTVGLASDAVAPPPVPSPVPLPAAMPLLLVGLGGLAALRMRRRA